MNRRKPDGRNVGLKPNAAELGRAASGKNVPHARLIDVANPGQQTGRDTGYHSLRRSTVRAGDGFDLFHSYSLPILASAGCAFVAACFILLLPKPTAHAAAYVVPSQPAE
jgi:hypothetical protein